MFPMLIKEKTNPTARLCRNRERGRNCKGRVHSRARIAAGLLSLVKFTAAPGCCMLGTSDHASVSHGGGPCLRVTRWWTMPPCHTVGKRKPECDEEVGGHGLCLVCMVCILVLNFYFEAKTVTNILCQQSNGTKNRLTSSMSYPGLKGCK